MSVAPIPGTLRSRDQRSPRWWGRRARFAYGLVVIGIGLGGETWATEQDDPPGLTLSALLLVLGSGILIAAALGPAWPAIARALAPVSRVTATVSRRMVTAVGRAAARAALVLATGLRPVVRLSVRAVVATGRVLETAGQWLLAHWPLIGYPVGRVLTVLGRSFVASSRSVVALTRRAVVVTRSLLLACWRPIAVASTRCVAVVGPLLVALGRLASAIARSVASAADPVLALACRFLDALGSTLLNLGRRTFFVISACASTITLRFACWARRHLERIWPRVRSASTTVAAAVADASKSLARTMTPARILLAVVELTLVGLVVGNSEVWRWWIDGERMTGEVIDETFGGIGPTATITIRDPSTDHDATASLGFGVGNVDVGDTATVVLKPSNRSVAATKGVLIGRLMMWSLVALSAFAWPVWWWRRHRRRLAQTWPRPAIQDAA
jgi:hypothetical protein